MKRLKFLFLYSNLDLGGVQTLILRMSEWLHEHGHQVDLVIWDKSDGVLLRHIRQYANVHVLGVRHYQLLQLPYTASLKYRWSGFDVVHAFDPSSMWIGTQLARSLPLRLFVGVYHPEAYQFRTHSVHADHLRYDEALFSALPDCAITFMNEGTRQAHAHYYGRTFQNSPLIPLPIVSSQNDVTGSRTPHRNPYRIVSVGRFVDFKIYPIGVMDAISRLRQLGFDIQFDIYGYGPLEDLFRNHVEQHGYAEFVNIRGALQYEQFSTVLSKAFAFTGMGTSLLEAAILGIPSIAMKLYARDGTCYGYLSEQEGYNVGEDGVAQQVFDLLLRLFTMSESEYDSLCETEKTTARSFTMDTVMSRYVGYAVQNCILPMRFQAPSALAMLWSRLYSRFAVTKTVSA